MATESEMLQKIHELMDFAIALGERVSILEAELQKAKAGGLQHDAEGENSLANFALVTDADIRAAQRSGQIVKAKPRSSGGQLSLADDAGLLHP